MVGMAVWAGGLSSAFGQQMARVLVPEDVKTIQSALVLVADGGEILVSEGDYSGPINIERSVTIAGVDEVHKVVVEADDCNAIISTGENVVISNMTLHLGTTNDQYVVVEAARGNLLIENCDVICEGRAGVCARGAQTELTLQNSRIWGGQCGVLFEAGAKGTVQGCEIHDIYGIGIDITGQSEPTISNSILRNCQVAAVRVRDGGVGQIDNCEIEGRGEYGITVQGGELRGLGCMITGGRNSGVSVTNGSATLDSFAIRSSGVAGVFVGAGSRASLSNCDLRNGRGDGVLVVESGEATLRDCMVSGFVGQGVMAHNDGRVLLQLSTIKGNRGSGVLVSEGGRGRLDYCELWDNESANLAVLQNGTADANHCMIYDGHNGGVLFSHGSRGSLEWCEIYDNTIFGVDVRSSTGPLIYGCHIHDNIYYGVIVRNGGWATIQGCDLRGNQLGGLRVETGGIVLDENNQQ